MSEIEFHSPIGAPQKYEPIYVSVPPDTEDLGPSFDPTGSFAATEALAQQGSAMAQFVLGHMFLSGRGVDRDAAAAYRWFGLAAKAGRPDAINMVGRCHERGWGVPLDTPEAARCYRQAADNGSTWAMVNLGGLMLAGDGVERDVAAAVSLFVRAARRGNAKAMSMLGHCREEGLGGIANPAAAQRWFARGARRGCFRGQYNLARFLVMAGDIDAALPWLHAACAAAPPEFLHAAGEMLLQHDDPRLQAIGRQALSRS